MQADRSLRSVFVGNIPYDATEEKLRDIFSAVGPVLSFRILYDHETGKPKGYGFCEYKDQETATSAMRNLNGHDLGGRQLRVDSASNERARDEPDQQRQQQQSKQKQNQQHQQQQQQQQSMLGDGNLQMQPPPQAEPLLDAQTMINNELCSLSPERLIEILKQLKASLAINPNETRQLLVQSPQLGFAILQTLVMIKAIDAQTAMNTLHKQLMQPAPMPTMMTMMQPSLLNPYGFMGAQPHQPAPMPQPLQAPMLPNPNPMDPRVSAQSLQSVPVSLPQPTIQGPQLITNHNPMDPRMNPNPMDPRMNPNPMDPRMNSNPLDPRMNSNSLDPRISSQQSMQATPSLLHPHPQPNPMDPRVSVQSHQPVPPPQNPLDPRQVGGQVSSLDPRLNPADPRLQRLQ